MASGRDGEAGMVRAVFTTMWPHCHGGVEADRRAARLYIPRGLVEIGPPGGRALPAM